MAVIAALELDDPIAAGRGPRDAHRAHRRFGARADEADALDRRHQRADAFAELDFERARRAEAGAVARGGRQRLHQAARRVAVDAAAPTTSRSRCSVLPSTSSMRAPAARRMNSGDAPTALKARTGLSTPPGRI